MITKTSHDGNTFSVDTVEPATELLPVCKTYKGINKLLTATDHKSGEGILSCSGYNDSCVENVSYHPLMAAVHLSFSQHRPLILSPDMIWLTIVQGIAQHVRNNSANLRSKLVEHTGKIELSIERTDVFADSPETDWALIAYSLAERLQIQIGDKLDQLAADFSTTTELEKTVCSIAIMDVFEPYFEYAVYSVCGIPSIRLEGHPGDWEKLREKAKILASYGLDWWLQALSPVLHQFERAARGDLDLAHWQNIYKLKEAYGRDRINGWIACFFPYIQSGASGSFTVRNPIVTACSQLDKDESPPFITSTEIPSGLSVVPFKLFCAGEEDSMQFIGGFVGIEQIDEWLALRPKLGWAVRKLLKSPLTLELSTQYEALPPLEPDALDEVFFKIVSTRKYQCVTIPGDLIGFYKQCNGLVFNASGAGQFRSAKSLEILDQLLEEESTGPEEEDTITVNPEYWLKIFDYPNDCFVAIELKRQKGSKFSVCRVDPRAGKVDQIASTFTEFVNLVTAHGGST